MHFVIRINLFLGSYFNIFYFMFNLNLGFLYVYEIEFCSHLKNIIFVIYEEKKIPIIFLLFLLAGTGVFISSSIYIAFHLFAFIFLLLITLYFAKNFLENPGMLSGTVGAGFGLIMLSQVFFLLIGTSGLFYLLGHVFRLVGFIFLLVNYVLVLKK